MGIWPVSQRTWSQPMPPWSPWSAPGRGGHHVSTPVASELKQLLSLCLSFLSPDRINAAKNNPPTMGVKYPLFPIPQQNDPRGCSPRSLRGSQEDGAPPPHVGSWLLTHPLLAFLSALSHFSNPRCVSWDQFLMNSLVTKPFSPSVLLGQHKLSQVVFQ